MIKRNDCAYILSIISLNLDFVKIKDTSTKLRE